MKTYQAFAKTKENSELILTEIKESSIKRARDWFNVNTIKHETVYLKIN